MGKRDDVIARLKAFDAYDHNNADRSWSAPYYGGMILPLLKDMVTLLLRLADEDDDDGS